MTNSELRHIAFQATDPTLPVEKRIEDAKAIEGYLTAYTANQTNQANPNSDLHSSIVDGLILSQKLTHLNEKLTLSDQVRKLSEARESLKAFNLDTNGIDEMLRQHGVGIPQ